MKYLLILVGILSGVVGIILGFVTGRKNTVIKFSYSPIQWFFPIVSLFVYCITFFVVELTLALYLYKVNNPLGKFSILLYKVLDNGMLIPILCFFLAFIFTKTVEGLELDYLEQYSDIVFKICFTTIVLIVCYVIYNVIKPYLSGPTDEIDIFLNRLAMWVIMMLGPWIGPFFPGRFDRKKKCIVGDVIQNIKDQTTKAERVYSWIKLWVPIVISLFLCYFISYGVLNRNRTEQYSNYIICGILSFMFSFVVTYPIIRSKYEPSLNCSISTFNKLASAYKGGESSVKRFGRNRYLIRDWKLIVFKSDVSYPEHENDEQFVSLFGPKNYTLDRENPMIARDSLEKLYRRQKDYIKEGFRRCSEEKYEHKKYGNNNLIKDKGLSVLIIGNGFDLMHDLPTSYRNFMDTCGLINKLYTFGQGKENELKKKILESDSHDVIKKELLDVLNNRTFDGDISIIKHEACNAIRDCIDKNIWYEYFCRIIKDNTIRGINWIDFESEIRDVIRFADTCESDISSKCNILLAKYNEYLDFAVNYQSKINAFGNTVSNVYSVSDLDQMTVRMLRNRLYADLDRLIEALSIYLAHFVNSTDIEPIDFVKQINPDFIICFNYTDTYRKLYGEHANISFIHGEFTKKDSMVLGIDEYWESDREKRENVNYSIFKKYVQRIIKHSPTDWSKYLDDVSHVYVIGHSLDITDKDILYEYLQSPETDVTVYCKDAPSKGALIAKMISLIGQDMLIKKTTSYPCKMRFVDIETELRDEEKWL